MTMTQGEGVALTLLAAIACPVDRFPVIGIPAIL